MRKAEPKLLSKFIEECIKILMRSGDMPVAVLDPDGWGYFAHAYPVPEEWYINGGYYVALEGGYPYDFKHSKVYDEGGLGHKNPAVEHDLVCKIYTNYPAGTEGTFEGRAIMDVAREHDRAEVEYYRQILSKETGYIKIPISKRELADLVQLERKYYNGDTWRLKQHNKICGPRYEKDKLALWTKDLIDILGSKIIVDNAIPLFMELVIEEDTLDDGLFLRVQVRGLDNEQD